MLRLLIRMWWFLFPGNRPKLNLRDIFRTPESKLFARETDLLLDQGTMKMKALTYVQSLVVEGQVQEVRQEMAARGYDEKIVDIACRNMRLTMVLFFSCYGKDGKPLFTAPEDVGPLLNQVDMIKAWVKYQDAFMMTEEERGNLLRGRLQSCAN